MRERKGRRDVEETNTYMSPAVTRIRRWASPRVPHGTRSQAFFVVIFDSMLVEVEWD